MSESSSGPDLYRERGEEYLRAHIRWRRCPSTRTRSLISIHTVCLLESHSPSAHSRPPPERALDGSAQNFLCGRACAGSLHRATSCRGEPIDCRRTYQSYRRERHRGSRASGFIIRRGRHHGFTRSKIRGGARSTIFIIRSRRLQGVSNMSDYYDEILRREEAAASLDRLVG
jgi:hypothetical protein